MKAAVSSSNTSLANANRPVAIAAHSSSSNSNNNNNSTSISTPIKVKTSTKSATIKTSITTSNPAALDGPMLGTKTNAMIHTDSGHSEIDKSNDNNGNMVVTTVSKSSAAADDDGEDGEDDDDASQRDLIDYKQSLSAKDGEIAELKHELFILKDEHAIDIVRIDQISKQLIGEAIKVTRQTEQYEESQCKLVELMNDLKNVRLEASSSISLHADKCKELMRILSDKDKEISDLKRHNNDNNINVNSQHRQQLSIITTDISNNNNNNNNNNNSNNNHCNSSSTEELQRYQTALVNMNNDLSKFKQEVLFHKQQSIVDKRTTELLTKQLLEQVAKNQELQTKVQKLSDELMNVSKGKEAMATLVKVKDN